MHETGCVGVSQLGGLGDPTDVWRFDRIVCQHSNYGNSQEFRALGCCKISFINSHPQARNPNCFKTPRYCSGLYHYAHHFEVFLSYPAL